MGAGPSTTGSTHWLQGVLGALACVALAGVGLLRSGPQLLGFAGAEVYGHAWVQWWHGGALPGWPSGTELAVGAEVWPVIDPLPTALAAAVGLLVGPTVAWNLLALGAVALAFLGGWVAARRWGGHPLIGGLGVALAPVFAGSLASGLTEDWALGLVALGLGLLAPRGGWKSAVGAGALLGLSAWCGLYLALFGAVGALLVGGWELVGGLRGRPGQDWRRPLLAAAVAVALAAPAAALQGARLSGEGHRAGQKVVREEPLWRVNPWFGADAASFVVPGKAALTPETLVRLHPAYLGLVALGLGLWATRRRDEEDTPAGPWTALVAVCVPLALGPGISVAGTPVADNPVVSVTSQLPVLGLVNHHGRWMLVGQVALVLLAARGVRRLPRWTVAPVAGAMVLEFALVSPAPWPLPVTNAQVAPVFSELPADLDGRVLVVPLGGPGVHFQQPLFEQRAHGLPLAHRPNQPGPAPGVGASATGRWLAGPPESAPGPLDLADLDGIGAVVVRTDRVAWAQAGLGPPDVVAPGGAIWFVER